MKTKTKEEEISEKFDEQIHKIAGEIASWPERSVLVWNGEKFAVINDFGNTDYHYTRDIRSPCIILEILRDPRDTTTEDDFWSLVDLLDRKTGKEWTEKEVERLVEEHGDIREVCKKYGIDYEDVIYESSKAEVEDHLHENKDRIIDSAVEIQKEIEKWEA